MSPRYVWTGKTAFCFCFRETFIRSPEENIIFMHFCTAQIYLQFCASSATYLYEDHFDIHTSKNQPSLRATPDDSVNVFKSRVKSKLISGSPCPVITYSTNSKGQQQMFDHSIRRHDCSLVFGTSFCFCRL